MSFDSFTDEELMLQLQQGERDALAALVVRYQQDVFRFALHYLRDPERAREMAQESFLRIFTACDRFDTSRKFKPWMLCIVRNLCLNEIKRRKAVHMESLEQYASSARTDSGEILQASEDSPDVLMMTEERRDLVRRALDSLTEDTREIVVLRFFERMSARDIGEVVGATEGAVRTRLHRILKQLQQSFGEEKQDV